MSIKYNIAATAMLLSASIAFVPEGAADIFDKIPIVKDVKKEAQKVIKKAVETAEDIVKDAKKTAEVVARGVGDDWDKIKHKPLKSIEIGVRRSIPGVGLMSEEQMERVADHTLDSMKIASDSVLGAARSSGKCITDYKECESKDVINLFSGGAATATEVGITLGEGVYENAKVNPGTGLVIRSGERLGSTGMVIVGERLVDASQVGKDIIDDVENINAQTHKALAEIAQKTKPILQLASPGALEAELAERLFGDPTLKDIHDKIVESQGDAIDSIIESHLKISQAQIDAYRIGLEANDFLGHTLKYMGIYLGVSADGFPQLDSGPKAYSGDVDIEALVSRRTLALALSGVTKAPIRFGDNTADHPTNEYLAIGNYAVSFHVPTGTILLEALNATVATQWSPKQEPDGPWVKGALKINKVIVQLVPNLSIDKGKDELLLALYPRIVYIDIDNLPKRFDTALAFALNDNLLDGKELAVAQNRRPRANLEALRIDDSTGKQRTGRNHVQAIIEDFGLVMTGESLSIQASLDISKGALQ
jgi:hypothetical protein